MNFHEVKELVQYLENFLACPHCKTKYNLSKIFVIATIGNKGFLTALCETCKNQSFLNFILEKADQKIVSIKIKNTEKPISTNDVIDVHNFLKNFRGDFKELFKQP